MGIYIPTYGQVRLQVQQLMPEVQRELLDDWIQQVYQQILDQLPWKRQEAETVIQSPLSYNAGSITAVQGSTAIIGQGTNWTAAMNGLMIRINASGTAIGGASSPPPGSNAQEYYQFQYVSATSATLDRGFEQATNPILTSTLGAPGSGYAVGDVFNVLAGNGQAQGSIIQIGAGGSVVLYQLNTNGAQYSVASGVATTTGGNGTGLTINVTAITPSNLLPYRIDQAIFLLPSNCRICRQVRPLHNNLPGDPLTFITPAELNRIDPSRNNYGTPRYFCPTFDSFSSPPQMQLELYPVPNCPDSSGSILSFGVTYDFEAGAIDPTQTSVALLPWVRPSAIIAGVRAMAVEGKDPVAWNMHTSKFKTLVSLMLFNNALQRGNSAVRLAPQFKRQTPHVYPRGPWHRGYTG